MKKVIETRSESIVHRETNELLISRNKAFNGGAAYFKELIIIFWKKTQVKIDLHFSRAYKTLKILPWLSKYLSNRYFTIEVQFIVK